MKDLLCLTDSGRKIFAEYLQRIRSGGSESPPRDELSREPYSTAFSSAIQVDESTNFSSRIELGEYLHRTFQKSDRNTLLSNYGIWDWLALLWFDNICPLDQGIRKVRETARYILSRDRSDYYRHLILGSWDLYSLYGLYSRLFLNCPPYIHNDWTEQLASRQDIITNKGLIEAVDWLYWDDKRGRPKIGATDRKRQGNIRRLIMVIGQLDLTYDLHAMSADEILLLLPEEFDLWKMYPTK